MTEFDWRAHPLGVSIQRMGLAARAARCRTPEELRDMVLGYLRDSAIDRDRQRAREHTERLTRTAAGFARRHGEDR